MEGDIKQFSLVNFDYGVPFTFTEKIFNADEVTWKKILKKFIQKCEETTAVYGPWSGRKRRKWVFLILEGEYWAEICPASCRNILSCDIAN